MKKSELKTGMRIYFSDGEKHIVMLNMHDGDNLISRENGCLVIDDDDPENIKDWEYAMRVEKVCTPIDDKDSLTFEGDEAILWERTPEKTVEIDGIEYPESTLRSIIKKSHE